MDTHGGGRKVIELKRMPSEMIADKRSMFELFAKIKSLAQVPSLPFSRQPSVCAFTCFYVECAGSHSHPCIAPTPPT
eukprot:3659893-Rhodomonas_salina.1